MKPIGFLGFYRSIVISKINCFNVKTKSLICYKYFRYIFKDLAVSLMKVYNGQLMKLLKSFLNNLIILYATCDFSSA